MRSFYKQASQRVAQKIALGRDYRSALQKGKLLPDVQAISGITMSSPANHTPHAANGSPMPGYEPDAVEAIVPLIPIVLPLVGAVLMFLLAFIAVYMA
jgi:hypothetical protein